MVPYTLMLLSHTLADYYFQPKCIAELKSKSTWYVLIHTSIYACVMLLSVLLFPCAIFFRAVLVASITHAIIDIVKQLILNHYAKIGELTVRQERLAYIIDQILHMVIILFSAFISRNGDGTFAIMEELNGYSILSLVCILLSVMKPANVFIQKILVTEKPDEKKRSLLRYGGKIGNLERLISAVMLYFGQYAAVALVFTAKSIVRFKDFEDREFAEYYLYGTLLSVATAIGVFMLIKLFGA